MHVYNIVLIGDNGVGKETMIKTFIFTSADVASVGALGMDQWNVHYFYVKTRLNEMHLAFTHIDIPTKGGKQTFFRNANAFILVYSSASAESFQSLKVFVEDTIKNPRNVCRVPLILVATKKDLPDQEVQFQEGLTLAQDWGIPFMEISCTDKDQLTEMFAQLVESIDESRRSFIPPTLFEEKKKDKQCCSIL